jgi:hypothetical protein
MVSSAPVGLQCSLREWDEEPQDRTHEEKNEKRGVLAAAVLHTRVGQPRDQQLLVALAGAVEDAVELQARQAELLGEAVLVLLGDVEAEQDLAVALVAQLLEHPAHQRGVLPLQQLAELAGARGDRLEDGLAVGLGLAAGGLAVVLQREVAGDLGEEAGELRGLAQLPVPQLLERQAEGVLEEVLGLGTAVGVAVEQERDAAAVAANQPLLGARISRPDPVDQLLGAFAVRLDGGFAPGPFPSTAFLETPRILSHPGGRPSAPQTPT